MTTTDLMGIREDINIILSKDVESCKSSVPCTVLSLTTRLKDSLYEKKSTDKEYKDEMVKLLSLTSKFQSNCKCSESFQYFPKLAVRSESKNK